MNTNKILTKLRLIDNFTFELAMDIAEFSNKLHQSIDYFEFDIASDLFEPFNSGKKVYKGQVYPDGFKIKHRREFFNSISAIPVAEGYFEMKDNKLLITTQIKGLRTGFFLFFLLIASLFILFLTALIFSHRHFAIPAVLVIFLSFSLMLLILYYMIRQSIKSMKYELEREFFYLTKD